MGGYLVNFSVYTFAMIGFLYIAVAVYKKTNLNLKNTDKNGGMEIEESLALSPRKRLHVVRVNDEKFLIAADVERTEFLAKLGNNDNPITKTGVTFKDNLISLNKNPKLVSSDSKIADFSQKVQEKFDRVTMTQGNTVLKAAPSKLSHIKSINMKKPPMMREILRKLEVVQG